MSEESKKKADSQRQPDALPTLVNPPKPIGQTEAVTSAEDSDASVAETTTPSPEPRPDPEKSDQQLAFLWQVHQYVNGYIKFSDQKAGVVIVFAVGVLAAMYGRSLHVPIFGNASGSWSAISWVSLGAFVLLILALFFAGWSIRPRLKSSKATGFIFWEGILAHTTAQSFYGAYRNQSKSSLTEHLATHLYELAGVCTTKYEWVSASVIFVLLGGIAGAIAIAFA